MACLPFWIPRYCIGLMAAREQLIAVLEDCVTRAQGGELTLGEVFDKLHESSFPLITIVMILPFLQPISLGPLATAGGLALTGLGWQMFRERETPWLPGRVRKISLNAKMWRILLRTCERVLSLCKKITRPRLKNLAIGRSARKLGGFLIAFSGLLMAIPFAGLPFNNTLPTLVMLFVAVGELEEDGFMVLLAVFFLALTVAYFSFILWALLVMGDRAFDWLRGLLPSL